MTGYPEGTRTSARDPRIERLIAVARVVLVALTLLALCIDPLDAPANNDRVVFILLSYFAASFVFAIIGFLDWRSGAWRVAFTEGAVKDHLHSISEKVGVRNRTVLALRMQERR